MIKKIIILDFETGEIYTSSYNSKAFKDEIEDFLSEFNAEFGLNLRATNCQWMIVNKLKINIL